MKLQAIVIGAGWAGEGHTIALRAAGVEVVAMCGRTPDPAIAMTQKLGISNVRFDWRQALEEFQPDIVAIATTAGPHCEIVETAARQGCHLMCDKPLATNAADARAMLRAVNTARVKHAYGTTSRYAPAVVYTRSLVANGLIGPIREIESHICIAFSPLLPYHWVHQLNQGGGLLNNMFTHKLGQVLHVTNAQMLAVVGEARRWLDRAPVGPTLHDCREIFNPNAVLTPEQAQASEWRTVDADLSYTVLARLQMPDNSQASALFQSTGRPTPHPDYLAFYGDNGTLYLTGPHAIQRFDQQRQTWEDLPIPKEVLDSLPQEANSVQRDWNQLFREFVADVRGESYAGYPTFHDGWVAAEVIEIVRSGRSWTKVPEHPDDLG